MKIVQSKHKDMKYTHHKVHFHQRHPQKNFSLANRIGMLHCDVRENMNQAILEAGRDRVTEDSCSKYKNDRDKVLDVMCDRAWTKFTFLSNSRLITFSRQHIIIPFFETTRIWTTFCNFRSTFQFAFILPMSKFCFDRCFSKPNRKRLRVASVSLLLLND